jgi:hypothetical protein
MAKYNSDSTIARSDDKKKNLDNCTPHTMYECNTIFFKEEASTFPFIDIL